LNRDPIEEAGGINLYGFVGNNPVYGIDPYGLCSPQDFINRFWPLFFPPSNLSPAPAPENKGPNSSGRGTVKGAEVSGGSHGGVVQAGIQHVSLENGDSATYGYLGLGIGTPGLGGSAGVGKVWDVYQPSDYAGPFVRIGGGYGVGGCYSAWQGGASSATGGVTTPGICVTCQYYVQVPTLYPTPTYPPLYILPTPWPFTIQK
jgi:hypothetical protein